VSWDLKAVCWHVPIVPSLLFKYGFHIPRVDMGWTSRQPGALSTGWTAGPEGAALRHRAQGKAGGWRCHPGARRGPNPV